MTEYQTQTQPPAPEVKTHRELGFENVIERLDAIFANLEFWTNQMAARLSPDDIGKLNGILSELAALCPSRPTHAPMDGPYPTAQNPPVQHGHGGQTKEDRRPAMRA